MSNDLHRKIAWAERNDPRGAPTVGWVPYRDEPGWWLPHPSGQRGHAKARVYPLDNGAKAVWWPVEDGKKQGVAVACLYDGMVAADAALGRGEPSLAPLKTAMLCELPAGKRFRVRGRWFWCSGVTQAGGIVTHPEGYRAEVTENMAPHTVVEVET